jgi:hypothetical protein
MDATRTRRTRDQARQGWYARHRQWRFARYLGFPAGPEIAITATITMQLSAKVRAAIGPGPDLAPICPSALISERHSGAFAVAAR